jgi:translation elongation factor P/translation initiation factor 5A
MPLEQEFKLFESERAAWLREHEGQFVLIKGAEYSFHDTDEEAYQVAVDKYGNEDVFIKQVLAKDRVEDSLSLLYGLVHVES